MSPKNAMKHAEASARHAIDTLLPEILLENQIPPGTVGYLVASAVMSPTVDFAKQVNHLSMSSAAWNLELVNQWAGESAKHLESILHQFQTGTPIEILAQCFSDKHPPVPFALVQDKKSLIQHLTALLTLHGGEISYYDYFNGRELLLVLLVLVNDWRAI